MTFMPAKQEKPMRHVMVFARAFRAPLQGAYTPDSEAAPDEFTMLLELADKRVREEPQGDASN